MLAVSNTSPLIFITKVPRLISLLYEEYPIIVIPEAVYNEAIEVPLKSENGEIVRSANEIEALVAKDIIQIKAVKKERKLVKSLSRSLSLGEAEALALAVQEGIEIVLIDERKGTAVAISLGLLPKPISSLPIRAAKRNTISKEYAMSILDELLANQYRLSITDYKKIVALLDE